MLFQGLHHVKILVQIVCMGYPFVTRQLTFAHLGVSQDGEIQLATRDVHLMSVMNAGWHHQP